MGQQEPPRRFDLALNFDREELDAVLSPAAYSAEKLIALFQTGITPPMYDSAVGVMWPSKGRSYTLAEHSLRVVQGYDTYFAHNPLPGNYSPGAFRVGLTLHDITKDRAGYSPHTLPVARSLMEALDFTPAEVNVIVGLLSDNPLGAHLMNFSDYRDPATVFQYITEIANIAEMTVKEFLELLIIYYTVDASSYEHLEHLFTYNPKLRSIGYSVNIQKAIETFRGMAQGVLESR